LTAAITGTRNARSLVTSDAERFLARSPRRGYAERILLRRGLGEAQVEACAEAAPWRR